jgi:3-deoxy-D-manno-octulosonate 8-phosphate phosphatase (KDO 8-P phosphatase)
MVNVLSADELTRRARRCRLVLSDVDGVLTDAGVFYSARGEELVRFSRRDGLGVELLRAAGIETGLVSRENSPIVRARAEKLGLGIVALGIQDKLVELPHLLSRAERTLEEVAYLGDDVNDLGILGAIAERGLCGAPGDADSSVRRIVHRFGVASGGHGAFREFADWILSLRQKETAHE